METRHTLPIEPGSDSRRRRALVTGATGQDGTYLTELLLAKGYEVHGTTRHPGSLAARRLSELVAANPRSAPQFRLHCLDLTEAAAVSQLISVVEPDEIYNLAAQSHVGRSFELSFETLEANARGALSVLEAARRLNDETRVRVYHASSSEMFGAPREFPQNEQTAFRPRNPYACAKVYGFHQAVCFRDAYHLFVCNGILYNHESPRRPANYVTRKITRAAARIAAGLDREVILGNLDGGRDWGYAPEYVEAMWRMLQQPAADDYVIATNEWHSLPQLLELAFSRVGRNWKEHVRSDPRLARPAETGRLQGDYSKAERLLGWKPTTSFESLIALMVDFDCVEVAREAATALRPQ